MDSCWKRAGADQRGAIRNGHKDDFAIGPLIAILALFHNILVGNTALSSLHKFPGTHTVTTSAFSPPFDTNPRKITSVVIAKPAETFSENIVGGPAKNPNSFNPDVVQWGRPDGSVGWLTLYAQVKELTAIAKEGVFEPACPLGNSSSTFQLLVASNSKQGKRDVVSWADVEGVNITVKGTVDQKYSVTFSGLVGGAGDTINDFEFWVFTYGMPAGSEDTPSLRTSDNLI